MSCAKSAVANEVDAATCPKLAVEVAHGTDSEASAHRLVTNIRQVAVINKMSALAPTKLHLTGGRHVSGAEASAIHGLVALKSLTSEH